MRLFKEENFLVIIDPELRLIPEFKRIIERDRDRFKKLALKELAFIYFTQDHRSAYADMGEKEKLEKVINDLKLENWKPDDELKLAIQKYQLLQQTASTKTLAAIKEGLLASTRAIDALTNQINKQLQVVATLDEDGDDTEPMDVSAIITNVTALLTLSEKLPKALTSISSLEEQIKKEQATDTKIRGGGSKGHFED